MKKNLLNWMTILMVAIVCAGFTSCGDDDESGKTADSDLMGIWINETYLNKPSYYLTHSVRYFAREGEVQKVPVASTAWWPDWKKSEVVKLMEYNNNTFYCKYSESVSYPYIRNGKQVIINPTGNNPEIGTLSSSNRLVLSDGAYIRVVDGKGKVILGNGATNNGNNVNTLKSCPDLNHPHAIDLGLPSGTKWACCNVGAKSPEEYGNYFAWGETIPRSYDYTRDDYTHYDIWTGYINIGTDIAGTNYDAATANWDSPWRMPSLTQINELLNNTSFVKTSKNGVNGWKFKGKNGGTVFLPAAGMYTTYNEGVYGAGWCSLYWSSTRCDYDSYDKDSANDLYIQEDAKCNTNSVYYAGSVRPVRQN